MIHHVDHEVRCDLEVPPSGREPQRAEVPQGANQRLAMSQLNVDDRAYHFRVEPSRSGLDATIAQCGQQVPIIVRPHPTRPGYQIIDGFRRVGALQRLGATEALAVVRTGLADSDAFTLALVSNCHHRPLTDLDRGLAIVEHRLRFHQPLEVVMSLMRLQRRQVLYLQRLTTLPQIVQAALSDPSAHFTATHALRLMEHLGRPAPDAAIEPWLAYVREHRASVNALVARLQSRATDGSATPSSAATAECAADKGGGAALETAG